MDGERGGMVAWAGTKLAAVLSLWGVSSWSEAAGFFATLVSICVLSEYGWKYFKRAVEVYKNWKGTAQ